MTGCRRLRRLSRDAEGSALLETVVAFPALLLFVFVLMELSLMYNGKQLANHAAFCAARTAAVYGIDSTAKTHLAAAMVMSSIASPNLEPDHSKQVLKAYGVKDADKFAAALCSIPGFHGDSAQWLGRLANAYARTYLPQCDTGTSPGKTRKHVVVNVTYIYRCNFLPFGNIWGKAGIDAYCDMVRDVFDFVPPGYNPHVESLIDLIRSTWQWNITIHGRAVTDYWAG